MPRDAIVIACAPLRASANQARLSHAHRVANYHHATLHSLTELIAAAGLEHPQELRPIHFSQRRSTTEVRSFAQLYPELRPGELLEGTEDARFRDAWRMAQPETFQPAL